MAKNKTIEKTPSGLKESFSGINMREFYNWPLPVQIVAGLGVFAAMLGAATYFDFSAQNEELVAAVEKEAKLKEAFLEKKGQAVNLNLYKAQLETVIRDSDLLLKQLPNKLQIEQLLIDINQSGVRRGLQFDLFKPGQEKLNEFYAEIPISIKVNGTYENIGEFTSDVAQLSRVVLFTDMEIATKDDLVTLTATAKTFRYLDEEELAEQARKKKEAANKKKKGGAKK